MGQRGQKQGSQNGDDRDDDQELDQGEPGRPTVKSPLARLLQRNGSIVFQSLLFDPPNPA